MNKLLIFTVTVLLNACSDGPQEDTTLEVTEEQVQEELDEVLDVDENGLSEGERQEMYLEFYNADVRAREEAEETFLINSTDLYEKNKDDYLNMNDTLAIKYREKLIEKYAISEDQYWDIVTEGTEKNWAQDLSYLYE